jgi:hypothetical protein
MRAALCENHLFNDKMVMHDRFFYIKTNYVGREEDNRKTERERESVCERQCIAGNER